MFFYCIIDSKSLTECIQVINRAKLERAGKDNVFVKLLYGKDRAMVPQSIEEQQRIGRVLLAAPAHASCEALLYFDAAAAALAAQIRLADLLLVQVAELILSSISLHQAHVILSHTRQQMGTIGSLGLCRGLQSVAMHAGWARMSLLVLYFSPDHLRNPTNFEAVSNKLICSPVTQILVFTKVIVPPPQTPLCVMECIIEVSGCPSLMDCSQ